MTMYQSSRSSTHPLDKYRTINAENISLYTLTGNDAAGIFLISPLLSYGATNSMLSSPDSNTTWFARSATNVVGSSDIIWKREGTTAFGLYNYTSAIDTFAIDDSGSITTVKDIEGVGGEFSLFYAFYSGSFAVLTTSLAQILPECADQIDFSYLHVGSFRLLIYASGSVDTAAASKAISVKTAGGLELAACGWTGSLQKLYTGIWTNFNEGGLGSTTDPQILIYASGSTSEVLKVQNIKLQFTSRQVV